MRTMAMALTQWVSRTQNGWMTGPAGPAGISARSWVASIDMACFCDYAIYSKLPEADRSRSCAAPLNYVNKAAPDAPARMLRRTNSGGETHVEDRCRQFLRRFPHRPSDQACHASHDHRGRRGALQWSVRPAFCGPVLRCLRARDRLSVLADR